MLEPTPRSWTSLIPSKDLAGYALLLALSFGLYFESLRFGYVLDDVIVLSENSFVQKGYNGIWDLFSKETFIGYFGEQKDLVAGARYRPLSLVSFALEHEWFGIQPRLSHLFNILLYALTGCVLFRLTRLLLDRTSDSKWLWSLPLLTSMLFIGHPIHSEAVANIKGRDEIMCLLFSLAALVSWLRFHDTRGRLHLGLSILWFLLALFSKENAVTFIAVIPLSLYFFRKVPLKQAILSVWPLWLCFVFFLMVRWQVIGYFLNSGVVITDLMNNPFIGMSLMEKWATIFYTIAWYFKLLVFPHPLTHDYYPYHVPKSDWTSIISWTALLISAALLWLSWRKRLSQPILSYSIGYFFITFSIVSNFVFPVGTFMNERFLFMPSVGFSLCCAYGLQQASSWNGGKLKFAAWAVFLAVLSAYAFKTIDRVPDWKDGFSLNSAAVKVSQNSARINLMTGVSYFQKYQVEDVPAKKYENLATAEKYIDKALSIFPEYGQGLNMKAGILAEWLKKDNDINTFLTKLESVIKVKPDLDFVTKYMEYLTKDPENNVLMFPYLKHVGYDLLYKEKRNYQFALHFLGMAYKINSQDADLCFYIGSVYRDMARFGKLSATKIQEYEANSRTFLQTAATLDPKYAQ